MKRLTPTALASAVDKAGTAVRGHFARPDSRVATRKSDGTSVTTADLEANRILKQELGRLDSAAGWRSEEDPASGGSERFWIVDPLDGTQEFVQGVPEFALSVALVDEGRLAAAAVLNPITGELGAWAEGAALFWRGFTDGPTSEAISVSRSEVRKGLTSRLEAAFPIQPVGSCAYKLLRAARGVESLYVSLDGKSVWDIAGGHALLLAAGKRFQPLSEPMPTYTRAFTRLSGGFAAGTDERVASFLDWWRRPQLQPK